LELEPEPHTARRRDRCSGVSLARFLGTVTALNVLLDLLREPLNPRTDYTEWKRLLERASVPERRLHDARHTAATVLLLLGIPDRIVMGIMGWSSTAMAARYQHIIAAIRRDVATSVGRLLWKPVEQSPRWISGANL
jgi:integrase